MLIRAFLWGNDLKAFLLLKSAIFAFPHECHKKPTTATTTWNSKQKLKSAIFCFFSHSFSVRLCKSNGDVQNATARSVAKRCTKRCKTPVATYHTYKNNILYTNLRFHLSPRPPFAIFVSRRQEAARHSQTWKTLFFVCLCARLSLSLQYQPNVKRWKTSGFLS